jgi:ElaB/YqjD/DUF883 family membrane-anchored ribosome-binding protein
MCFDLGIEYESIPGRGKSERVDELVYFAQRNGRLNDFAAYVKQTRAFIQLRMTDTLPDLPETVSGSGSGTVIVKGDLVQGDKMDGDKVQGDQYNLGDISNVSGLAVGKGAKAKGGDIHTGDKIDMSGDFRGANVNLKSTLTNVNQTIGALPNADDAAKAELQKLITQLNEALQQVPAEKAEEAEAIAQMAEEFVETANSEKPNKVKMKITGEGLKMAAENLAAIVPDVVKIAGAIVTGILGLG